MGYQFKTKPRIHQAESLRVSVKQPVWAHFHEQRTGKTKIVIDTAGYHYEAPDPNPLRINCLIIIAMPSGVPAQWVLDEIPKHLPDRIPRHCVVWRAQKVKTKYFQQQLTQLITFKGLSVLALNGEALTTIALRAYILKLIKARRCMVAIDESTLVCKTAGTQRTKMVRAIRRQPNAVIRRIMDGTPYGESPMDWWAQFMFLDERILGHDNFYTYRNHYTVLEKNLATKTDPKTGQPVVKMVDGKPVLDANGREVWEKYEYEKIVGYRNLDELHQRIARYSDRVRRADVSDAPPKTYTKLRFDLTPEQRRVYDQIENEHQTMLRTGHLVTAAHVLTRKMRLQQITSNILPTSATLQPCGACQGMAYQVIEGTVTDKLCEVCDGLGVIQKPGPVIRIDAKTNPRLETLHDNLMIGKAPSIVWCRFQSDVDDVMAILRKANRKPVQYDGRINSTGKDAARMGFQSGDFTDVVGNPKAGGRGLRLDRAEVIYYYSNLYSLLTREQSEDRAEDLDRKISTTVTDLMANDTEDEVIVADLREKRSLSEIVMRESRGQWI